MYPYKDDLAFGTFVSEQVNTLRSSGVDVDVLFVNGRSSRLNYLIGILRLWRQLLKSRYDIIHAHYVYSGWIARMQWKLPVVVSFHGSEHRPGAAHELWLCRHIAPIVNACTVTSIEHKGQIGFDRSIIVPCGVDTELFRPEPRESARKKLGWSDDRQVMLYVGADRPEKRLDIIRGANDILQARRDDIELVCVHGLNHADVPVYLNAADVMVLASDSEGSPVCIKEAMACNLPIVSTAVGDVPEMIDGIEGCYLCEQSSQDMADKVELALAYGKRTNGREKALELSLEKITERLISIYNDCLQN